VVWAGSWNKAISYVVAMRLHVATRQKLLKLRVPVFVVFCVEAGSLNEAICYVWATRLRVAARQT